MAKAFISYSHKNERALERLHTHLAMLRREGLISEWFDREILAGKNLNKEIQTNLGDSDLFIALVSPDFLASNYCYEREMSVALKRHEDGSIQFIPVIIEACDWKSSPLGQIKALPKDGKPISMWTNEDVAYLDIVTELRRLLMPGKRIDVEQNEKTSTKSQAKRYRIKKEFDAIDRADFARKAFDDIRDYFERSVKELNEIGDPIRARFERMGETGFTCTVLNKASRNSEGHITVHLQGERGFGDITYSHQLRGASNTSNGHVRVSSDEYEQYLTLDTFRSSSDRERLSALQVADGMWRDFLSRAGIEHA